MLKCAFSSFLKGLMKSIVVYLQAIGNQEFHNGPATLIKFMKQADFSIVCSNMNVSQEPIWPDPPIYTPSTIINKGGKKIGVIGYTTPDIIW